MLAVAFVQPLALYITTPLLNAKTAQELSVAGYVRSEYCGAFNRTELRGRNATNRAVYKLRNVLLLWDHASCRR